MKKLICFGRHDDEFIYSTEYELKLCPDEIKIIDFLTEIQNKHDDDMKIVQINFEYEHQNLFKHQKNLYKSAKASVFILKECQTIKTNDLLKILSTSDVSLSFELLDKRESFCEKVNYIKEQIKEGRLYQVNLTTAAVSSFLGKSDEIFSHFFNSFNGSYKALLPFENHDLISFSPELFLKKEKQRLITCPIKGSAPQENNSDATELLKNLKEEAELSMIVDLLRNDLNKVAALDTGRSSGSLSDSASAVVTRHRDIMSLGYIRHTYSQVELQTDQTLPAILDCTLPGGSISGCPKIESLKLIAEIETIKRQNYTGAAGWWQNNEFCLNLSIRSFIRSEGNLYYHAGCGIVYDSKAEAEWDEFILKTGRINAR